jgi:hypothetical protein
MFERQKPDDLQLPADLAAFERGLTELSPAAVRMDRDRLMFAAGRAAGGGGVTSDSGQDGRAMVVNWSGSAFWPAATAMMTAATILLATMLVWQHADRQLAAKPQADVMVTVSADGEELKTRIESVDREPDTVNRGRWPWSARPTSGYLGLRNVALAEGVAAIENRSATTNGPSGEPSSPMTARGLLEELLPAAGRASS